MMQGPSNPKMRGVITNAQPLDARGQPRTVAEVLPLEQYAVRYYDETGAPRVNILIKVGNQLYFAPNGVDWAAALKPCAEWVRKGVLPKIGTGGPPEELPKADTVSVIPEGGDGNNSSAE